MISAGARYVTSRRPCTVTIQPERASASSVTTGKPGPSGPLKGVPADDHLHGQPPDRSPRSRNTGKRLFRGGNGIVCGTRKRTRSKGRPIIAGIGIKSLQTAGFGT